MMTSIISCIVLITTFLYIIFVKGVWALFHPLKNLEMETDNPELVRTFTRKDRFWQILLALSLVTLYVTVLVCPY